MKMERRRERWSICTKHYNTKAEWMLHTLVIWQGINQIGKCIALQRYTRCMTSTSEQCSHVQKRLRIAYRGLTVRECHIKVGKMKNSHTCKEFTETECKCNVNHVIFIWYVCVHVCVHVCVCMCVYTCVCLCARMCVRMSMPNVCMGHCQCV